MSWCYFERYPEVAHCQVPVILPSGVVLASQPRQLIPAASRKHTAVDTRRLHAVISPVVEDSWSEPGGGRDIASLLPNNRTFSADAERLAMREQLRK